MRGGSRHSGTVAVLLAGLVLIMPAVAIRALRAPGLSHALGLVLCALVVVPTWLLLRRARGGPASPIAVAGALLVAPFGMIGLAWVGLGTPWEATEAENVMRYGVLLVAAVLVTAGLVLLAEALALDGERTWSSLGRTAALLAGAAYVVWISFQLGLHAAVAGGAKVSDGLRSVADVLDTLLFAAGATTYLAVSCLAAALAKTGWIGPGWARLTVVLNLFAVVLLALRGVSFPDPGGLPSPWYLEPGFVVGIPAMPWIVPYLLGTVCLRRAAEAGDPTALGS